MFFDALAVFWYILLEVSPLPVFLLWMKKSSIVSLYFATSSLLCKNINKAWQPKKDITERPELSGNCFFLFCFAWRKHTAICEGLFYIIHCEILIRVIKENLVGVGVGGVLPKYLPECIKVLYYDTNRILVAARLVIERWRNFQLLESLRPKKVDFPEFLRFLHAPPSSRTPMISFMILFIVSCLIGCLF